MSEIFFDFESLCHPVVEDDSLSKEELCEDKTLEEELEEFLVYNRPTLNCGPGQNESTTSSSKLVSSGPNLDNRNCIPMIPPPTKQGCPAEDRSLDCPEDVLDFILDYTPELNIKVEPVSKIEKDLERSVDRFLQMQMLKMQEEQYQAQKNCHKMTFEHVPGPLEAHGQMINYQELQPQQYIPGQKTKRFRTAYTSEQLNALEKEFASRHYVPRPERIKMAEKLNVSEIQIKVWFQNRRMKLKREVGSNGVVENSMSSYHNSTGVQSVEVPVVPSTPVHIDQSNQGYYGSMQNRGYQQQFNNGYYNPYFQGMNHHQHQAMMRVNGRTMHQRPHPYYMHQGNQQYY